MFSESVYKTFQRQPTELKLSKLIVQSMFHKICKFKNHVTRDDVIITSLPKTIEKQWRNADLSKPNKLCIIQKVLMRAIQKCNFIEFERLCQKLWAFLSKFGIFFTMPAHQIWSCHVTQVEKFLSSLNSAFNIRKSHKISSRKPLYFRRCQLKTSQGVENTPQCYLG